MKRLESYIEDKEQSIDGRCYISFSDCMDALQSLCYDMMAENYNHVKIDRNSAIDAKEYFEEFRKAYKGTKRGLDTEFSNFKKKHKDYAVIAPMLFDIYTMQDIRRMAMSERGDWVPMLPNMQTYINQRRWEEEVGEVAQCNGKKYNDDFGDGVYFMNGKKYYGNGIEIPASSPKRPSSQYTYNHDTDSWYIE